MATFREVRDLLLSSHDEELILDDELVMLFEQYQSTNLDLPYDMYPAFNLDDMEEDECLAEFRVEKRYLPFFCRSTFRSHRFSKEHSEA